MNAQPNPLKEKINELWAQEDKSNLDLSPVHEVIEKLDRGELRSAYRVTDFGKSTWFVNEYVKKAILLWLRFSKSRVFQSDLGNCYDKIPLKTENWTDKDFTNAGFRVVPGGMIRYGSFISKSVVVMPAFINVGVFIGEGTMIDSNSLVGSCAQIGMNCHISDGVTIGGVLEPLQSTPVIIEDNCFIGVRSSVTEGVIVEEGSVIGAGTILTASTRIIDRRTGDVSYGKIPAYSVVVPGAYAKDGFSLYAAIIVKQVDQKTREKTAINELLRY